MNVISLPWSHPLVLCTRDPDYEGTLSTLYYFMREVIQIYMTDGKIDLESHSAVHGFMCNEKLGDSMVTKSSFCQIQQPFSSNFM